MINSKKMKVLGFTFVSVVFFTAMTANAIAVGNHGYKFKHKQEPKPLLLKEQGSFYAGGEIVTIPSRVASGTPQPGQISINHVYAQYQIPLKQKYRYPVIMVHGGGHTGKTYETTPDGREGWYTSLTRRGFASYVMDDPNRGRAC